MKIIITFILSIIWVNALYSSPNIRVHGSIDNISSIKLLNVLSSVPKNSIVKIELINNPGGSIIKETNLMNLLEKYKKWKNLKYHFKIRGYCHSACTSLLMIATKVSINDNIPMVFHTIQHCIFNRCWPVTKGREVRKMYRKYGNYYRRILTKKQWVRFQNGEDVLVYGKQFKKNFI